MNHSLTRSARAHSGTVRYRGLLVSGRSLMAGVTSPSGAASTQRAPGAPELRSATTSCGGPTSHSPRAGSVTERPGRRCPARHPVDARPPQGHRRRSRRAGGARRDPHVGGRSPLNPHADGRWQHERDLADK
jgi:hypothetical protein